MTSMKYALFLFVLIPSFIQAQKLTTEQVPAAASKALIAAYPEATEVKWEKKKELFKGGFKIGKTDHDLWLASDGKIMKHRVEIKKEELPAAVQETIKKEFSGYKASDCEKTDESGIATYKVELKNETDKKNVRFEANGKIIPKKNDD
jgi:hypothetical protein